MKTCMIYGNLYSDRSSENYPIEQVCDECFEADKQREDDAQIVSEEDYNSAFDDDPCYFCGKTYKKELREKKL